MTLRPNDSNRAADAVRRYVSLLATGGADDLVALFADGATVEDPVGSNVRTGRQEIRSFFAALEQLDRETELVLLRTAGNEAAFVFTIKFNAGGTPMRLQPIDTMLFNEDGEIVTLRSYFAPEDVAEM
jgi:steroid Delta-isomerase